MQQNDKLILVLALTAAAMTAAAPARLHAGDLDLPTALARVADRNPRMAAFDARRREARARVEQAGRLRNPSLSTEVENVAGSGGFSGTDQAETTVLLSQSIELGGKRERRKHAAELAEQLADRDHERARVEALHEATLAFVDALAGQQELALADEAIALADQVLATVRRRVEAGSSSRIELTRAQTARSSARLQRERAVRRLESARRRLAGSWGDAAPDFERVVGSFGSTAPLPDIEDLRSKLNANPELARWTAEMARSEALVELEESRSVPDVTIGAGYRRLSGPEQDVVVAALSFDLPLFDRNQAMIREARERASRTSHERRAATVGVQAALAEAYAALATAHAEIRTLEREILPGVSATFSGLREGFREGRFSYLEVLDSQRTLVSTRAQRTRTLADYHRAVARIERLTGSLPTGGLTADRDAEGLQQ